MGADPVTLGLVASFNRPGGNMTGMSSLNAELGPKRLELIRELLPRATSIALLVNPTNSFSEVLSRNMQLAARTLGVQLPVLQAASERDLDAAFDSLSELRANGLVVATDGFLINRAEQLGARALGQRLPAIFQSREFTAAGGLMSYGGSLLEEYRFMGQYTGRILRGEKASDLPVQQLTKIELIINMKTAKALGVTFPITLLGRADEVIE
jgi:putative ABC transport system substrate-binding protein